MKENGSPILAKNTSGTLTFRDSGDTVNLTIGNIAGNTTLAVSCTDVTATAAELGYVGGVTSAIQTQLNGKTSLGRGTYTGDGTVNRAIAHGLGSTPKLILILNTTVATYVVIDGTTGNAVCMAGAATSSHTQTAPTSTNFYVGKPATAGFFGNDDTHAYTWFAWY